MIQLLTGEQVTGTSRVVCFSPRHDRTLAQLPVEGIRTVVDTWAHETATLGDAVPLGPGLREQRCSHGVFERASARTDLGRVCVCRTNLRKRTANRQAYLRDHGSGCSWTTALWRSTRGERIVAQNDRWVALVPYWAVWPFELLLLPRTHIRRMPTAPMTERNDLAALLQHRPAGIRPAVLGLVPVHDGLAWCTVHDRRSPRTGNSMPTSIRHCCGRRR